MVLKAQSVPSPRQCCHLVSALTQLRLIAKEERRTILNELAKTTTTASCYATKVAMMKGREAGTGLRLNHLLWVMPDVAEGGVPAAGRCVSASVQRPPRLSLHNGVWPAHLTGNSLGLGHS